jgi:predicted house-cleaning noncanonical NTP pyrophosphatase (MazG superfamily)
MKYFRFVKLVRDKIVENMRGNNQKPRGVRNLNDEEFIKELIKKVVEESQEMEGFENFQELKEEIADVQEVLDYIKKEINLSENELKELQKKKIMKNGGFDKRVYMEDVGVEESNAWFKYYDSSPDKYPKVK